MAMLSASFEFDIYEISLRDKPKEMLKISPKGTVPVLIVGNNIDKNYLDQISHKIENKIKRKVTFLISTKPIKQKTLTIFEC